MKDTAFFKLLRAKPSLLELCRVHPTFSKRKRAWKKHGEFSAGACREETRCHRHLCREAQQVGCCHSSRNNHSLVSLGYF